jgi:hypothetical protein
MLLLQLLYHQLHNRQVAACCCTAQCLIHHNLVETLLQQEGAHCCVPIAGCCSKRVACVQEFPEGGLIQSREYPTPKQIHLTTFHGKAPWDLLPCTPAQKLLHQVNLTSLGCMVQGNAMLAVPCTKLQVWQQQGAHTPPPLLSCKHQWPLNGACCRCLQDPYGKQVLIVADGCTGLTGGEGCCSVSQDERVEVDW